MTTQGRPADEGGEPTRLDVARERLLSRVEPHDRVERVELARAIGRPVAAAVTAAARVPAHDRVVVDGYAVRAADTTGADERSPVALRVASDRDGEPDGPPDEATGGGTAVPVEAGEAVPTGTDAVVRPRAVRRVGAGEDGDVIEVSGAAAAGDGIVRAGGDVVSGQTLFDPGHEVRASDAALLKAAGVDRVPVARRSSVGVVPTGDELVQGAPGPGEVVETDGLALASLIDRWGGVPTYRNVVPDDDPALGAALTRETASDVIVLVGGTGPGASDRTVQAVAAAGEVLVHGVAMDPGGSVALGVVRERPVLVLPGAPAACTVAAVQFLRPVLRRVVGLPTGAAGDRRETATGTGPAGTDRDRGTCLPWAPTVRARLDGRVDSEPGVRTFATVRLRRRGSSSDESVADPIEGEPNRATDDPDVDVARDHGHGHGHDHDRGHDHEYVAVPARRAGGVLRSSVALSDGWVTVPESSPGVDAGSSVAVERWESSR